jgi:hypothetical protein
MRRAGGRMRLLSHLPARTGILITPQEKPMDIEKLLEHAADYCERATNAMRYLKEDRAEFARIADTCAHVAHVMIEYERLQNERLEAKHRQMLAQREIDESPF